MPLGRLVLDQRVQVRLSLGSEAVSRYASVYRDDGVDGLPPVIAFDIGEVMVLADGFHRVAAAKAAGLGEIAVEVRVGGWLDAYEHAVTANAAHGVPLDRAARAEAVASLLAIPLLGPYRAVTLLYRGERLARWVAHQFQDSTDSDQNA